MSVNGHDEVWAGRYGAALQHVAHKLQVPMTAIEEAIRWRVINHKEFEGRISPKSVVHVTCKYFGVRRDEIDSQSIVKHIVRARHTAMYVMRALCVARWSGGWKPITYQKIAETFNQKRHTAALRAQRVVRERMSIDAKYKKDISNIISLLGR